MDDNRRRDIENYIRYLKYRDSANTAGIISSELPLNRQAIQARDLSEDALAHSVLKNTGIPIPDHKASLSKQEDFLNRIIQERYPELENPNLRFKDTPGSHGTYDPNFRSISINPNTKLDMTGKVSTALHEAGHSYDDSVLGYKMPKELMKGHSSQLDMEAMYDAAKKAELDPTDMYEIAAKGHHANIPNLREGSYGKGALKSFLKSGNFRSVPVIGTGLAAYSALDTGDVMAAVPGLDSAENVGESVEEEKFMLAEDQARKNYEKSPAAAARKQALSSLAQPTLAKK